MIPGRKEKKKTAEDYRIRHFTVTEWIAHTACFAALDLIFSFLFYRSWIAALAGAALFPVFVRERKQSLLRERRRLMRAEFLTGAQLTVTALQAGYAAENAFAEALKELRKMYTGEEFIIEEFSRLTAGVRLNLPLEKLLADMANRSGVDDIERFSEVFAISRRSGGDLTAVMFNTIQVIQQKEETRREIETMLAGKEMEQTMMSVIPLCILAYVGMASPSFLAPMYHSPAGILIMSAALAVYAAGWIWGRRIIRIDL